MVTAGNYSAISGSWTAPAAQGNGSSTSADASWIGIGGVTSDDLIQVGSQNTVSASGQVSTSAFYELLPNTAQTIQTVKVSPGDSLKASLTEIGSNLWTIFIADNTTGQSFSLNVSYTSSNSSGEWIEEDPSYASGGLIPFDNFGTVDFSSGSVTSGGSAMDILEAKPSSITMVSSSGQVIAQPSSLSSDGAGFLVSRQNN